MYQALFKLDSFEYLSEQAQCAMMRTLCEALAQVNTAFLMNHRTPRLYKSGVRYALPGRTQAQPWRDVPLLLEGGSGACGELTAWRLAELRLFEGASQCVPLVTCRAMSGGLMFHVKVQDQRTGQTEDPSAQLGMGESEWVYF